MRPKGSERNKQIAVLFSNMVSLVSESSNENVPCKGPRSLFEAFSKCFPNLTRDSKDLDTANKRGVSIIEMNKSLASAGYQIFRKRERLQGAPKQMKRGTRRWRFRRWVDTNDPDDITHLRQKLSELHQSFPDTASVCIEDLITALSSVLSVSDLQFKDSSEDSDNDECPAQYAPSTVKMARTAVAPQPIPAPSPQSQPSSVYPVSPVDVSQNWFSFHGSASRPRPLDQEQQAPSMTFVPSIAAWGVGALRDTLSTTALRGMSLAMRFISSGGRGGGSLDDLLHAGRLGPLASAAMDLDPADAAYVAAVAAAAERPAARDRDLARPPHEHLPQHLPWHGSGGGGGGRAGLLSSRIPLGAAAAGWPAAARCCVRWMDPAGRPAPAFAGAPAWATTILTRLHQMGFREEDLAAEYSGLPADLSAAMQLALASLLLVVQARWLRMGIGEALLRFGTSGGGGGGPASGSGLLDFLGPGAAGMPAGGGPVDEGRWGPGVGAMRRTVEPLTQRTAELYFNAEYARMTGMEAEDLLSRFANSQMPMPFCQLDHVLVVLDQLHGFLQPTTTHCLRWAWPGRPARLVHRRLSRLFDAQGRCCQETVETREVSAAEFDALHESDPAVRDGCLLRLRRAMGDVRRGAEYLADFPADRATTVAAMQGTEAGRAALSALARGVTAAFVPAVGAARDRLGMVSDWIARLT